MSIPIFVLGSPRSGTTWIANILCSHDKIIGIQAERHSGIHESHFFSIVENRFGDISKKKNFDKLVDFFSKSDYFILSNLDKQIFYEKKISSYPEFFEILMNTYAEREKNKFWLEKSPPHSLFINRIKKYFTNAKFIIVKRNMVETIKSEIRLRYYDQKMKQKMNIPKSIFISFLILRYFLFYKHLEHYGKITDSYFVSYEKLRENRKEQTKKLCEFLQIKYSDKLLKDTYRKNTRFKKGEEREFILSSNEITFIHLMNTILNKIPYQFFKPFILLYKIMYMKSKIPSWFFTIINEEKKETTMN